MKPEEKIINLLMDFEFTNPELGGIITQLRDTILSTAPDAEEKIMFGGLIYSTPGRMFTGLFLRKEYVSVEFDWGHLLNDPDNHLEGSGKFRRHLKIHNEKELKTKRTEKFINESYMLEKQ